MIGNQFYIFGSMSVYPYNAKNPLESTHLSAPQGCISKRLRGGGTIDLEYVATSLAVYCQIRVFCISDFCIFSGALGVQKKRFQLYNEFSLYENNPKSI